MRQPNPGLPRYTWDQATILNLWPAASFSGFEINPATVRAWASDGLISAVGVGPRGCMLYRLEDVVKAAERERKKPGRPRRGVDL